MDAPLANAPGAPVYAFGDYRLDVSARVLWREGAGPVQLPSRALDSLVYLIEHRDRLVCKNELIDAVWPDVVVTDDSLIHAISVLRRALVDDPAEAHYVQTVPRRGYRFVAPVSAIAAATAPPRSERPAAASNAAPGARAATARRRITLAPSLLAASAIALVVGIAFSFASHTSRSERAAQAPRRAVRLFQPPPSGTTLVSGGVLSPDGEWLTFVARDAVSGQTALWVRALHSSEIKRLADTAGASKPFWSPDSSRLGFFTDRMLKIADLREGQVRSVAPVGVSAAGGSWARDDTILFADWAIGLFSVRASGSKPALVAALDPGAREIAISRPQFLPDGRRFLYHLVSLDAAHTGVYIGDLDTHRNMRLLDTESPAVFAPPHHLLHIQHAMLIAEELDTSRWQLTGRATVLARDVSTPSLADDNGVSAAGNLVAYRHGVRQQQLAWVDRAGEVLAMLPMPAVMFNPRMSPDGSHLLATGSVTTNPGLWIASLSRAEFERIETDAIAPLWSPDGEHIAFTARGGFDLMIRPSSALASQPLLSGGAVKILNDWSPAGDHIVYSQRDDRTKLDLWAVRVADGSTFPILASPNNELQARISPDGHWLAYVADDSGALEVYVQRYPDLGERYKVSLNGGGQPQWRRDQRELFFLAPDRTLMVVPVAEGDAHPFGAPRRLFTAAVAGGPDDARDFYAASADGARFLLDGAFGDGDDNPITVMVNWQAEAEAAPSPSAHDID